MTRARTAGVLLAVGAWWLCVGLAFAPGGTSPDVFLQYQEGFSGVYTNQHPVLLSILLGGAGRWFGTPAPVFWVQTGLYFGLAAALALRARVRRPLALGLLAIFALLPSSWAVAATLWKDVWFDLALLGAALALTFPRSPLRFALLVVAALGALLVRYNALPFALGLVGWAAWTHFDTGGRRAAAAVAGVVFVLSAPRLLDAVCDVEQRWSYGPIVVYDVVGVYAREPESYAESPLRTSHPLARLTEAYVPTAGWKIFGDFGLPGLRHFELSPLRETLSAEWLRVVSLHPGAYLAHRFMVFTRLLGFRMPVQHSLYGETQTRGFFPGPDTGMWLHRTLQAWRQAWRASPVFRVWFWALAFGLAWALAVRARCRDAVALGLLIGVTFAGYFFAAASAEFRYGHPLLVGAFALLWMVYAAPARTDGGNPGEDPHSR